jgi:hypothetical protein
MQIEHIWVNEENARKEIEEEFVIEYIVREVPFGQVTHEADMRYENMSFALWCFMCNREESIE